VADRESAVRRATIVRALEEKPPTAAVLALAPLFERFDPTAVAAALYDLWTSQVAATAPVASPEVPATAKLWVGIGKKDGATANDLMAALTREARIDRKAIGRIEVRELYCLVELPAQDVERAAALVNGLAIRKRRVSARVDRGGKPR
jgi:hypothetical protein